MPERRPISRVFLVVPGSSGPGSRPDGTLDALAGLVSDAMATRGVQVSRHLAGTAPEGSVRADVAIWLPSGTGALPRPEPREVPARVHAGFVTTPDVDRAYLSRLDAVLVPHEALVAPVRAAVERALGASLEVIPARLPAQTPVAREAAKAARKVGPEPVVLVDVREGFDAIIERVVFQIALRREPATVVLLADGDDAARRRVRSLCARHDVDAWLAAGPDALASALPAVDLLVGRPRWGELILAAAHKTAVAWVGDDEPAAAALLSPLRRAKSLIEVTGVLQLGAMLDVRLTDRGGITALGTALGDQLTANPRAFLEALGTLHPRVQEPLGAAAWEPVGPRGERKAKKGAPVVEAKDPDELEADRASRIEAALSDLKARMGTGEGAG
jgi:hypothetical protein